VERREVKLFVYGSLLRGEPAHTLLAGASLVGVTRTAPEFHLVDLGAYAALVRGGAVAVAGELYTVDVRTRAQIDVERQVPVLFNRERIRLCDGSDVDAYTMTLEQVRGRRRLAHGDWHQRFAPGVARSAAGPFVQWARGRFTR
jgi:gamma-glutamylaminecyclotransferase